MYKFLPLLLLVLFANCKKKDNSTGPSIQSYGGISATDANGDKQSNDPTDWTINETWNEKEGSLFAGSYSTGCPATFNYSIIGFPNPATTIFAIGASKTTNATLQMRIVDRNYNVLMSKDTMPDVLYINTSALGGVKDTVRVYYRFIENGCEFRGHGDVVLQ